MVALHWPLYIILFYCCDLFAFSALALLFGRQEGHPACKKTEWWGAGMIICLELGADLHMAQLMLLPLTVSCFSKIQIGFTFLVPAHLGSRGKRAVKQVCLCVCVCVCVWSVCTFLHLYIFTRYLRPIWKFANVSTLLFCIAVTHMIGIWCRCTLYDVLLRIVFHLFV